MRILLSGGAGYIGSHTARECLRAGHEPTILDNYTSGHPESIRGLRQVKGDLLDLPSLRRLFERLRFDAVVHLAGPGTVAAADRQREAEHDSHIDSTRNLLDVMVEQGVRRLVYCSTSAVYGEKGLLPVEESESAVPLSPFGRSRLLAERLLADTARRADLRYMILRTFNVAGADVWGDIGEDHQEESHIVPRLLLAALGQFEAFEIFGTDYDTPDGTCVRDFVHVTDVARAHVLALEQLDRFPNECVNIGSGRGSSVRQVVKAVESRIRSLLPVEDSGRRAGDPASIVASTEKAREILGWRPEYSDLVTILSSAWEWHRRHPSGYGGPVADPDWTQHHHYA